MSHEAVELSLPVVLKWPFIAGYNSHLPRKLTFMAARQAKYWRINI